MRYHDLYESDDKSALLVTTWKREKKEKKRKFKPKNYVYTSK